MYLLFRYKNWNPYDFVNMGPRTRKIMRIFLRRELEERQEELKALFGGGK